MSTDLAELGLSVDSRGFVRAERELNKFDKTASRVDATAEKLAKRAARLGRAFSVGITTPLLAAAAASVKAATTFDSELARINTLVGASREEIAGFRQEILQLAPAVGRGPAELARGLFAVTSAGARGTQALETLTAAAKASAIGLGDTRDIALAASAATTAYGEANLSATEAVEILVGTVEQGNLEASELAGVLGRVIGLTAETGVSFRDAGAFIAAFTRQGVDAAQAVTGLRGVLSQLVREPTAEAKRAFDELGLSIDGFRQDIQDNGFIETFQDLVNRAQESGVSLGRIIPEVEALAGALSVFASEGSDAAQIAEDVGKAVGTLEDRLQAAIELDPALAFSQLRAELETISIELGANILPAVIEGASIIRDLSESFRDLTPETQRAVIQIAALTAAIGPLLLVLSALINSLRTIIPLLAGRAGLGGAAVAAGFAIGSLINNAIRPAISELSDLKDELAGLSPEADRFTLAVAQSREELLLFKQAQIVGELQDLSDETSNFAKVVRQELTADLVEVNKELSINGNRVQALKERLEEGGTEVKNVGEFIASLGVSAAETARELLELADNSEPATEEINKGSEAAKEYADTLNRLRRELGGPVNDALNEAGANAQDLFAEFLNGQISLDEFNEGLELNAEILANRVAPAIDDILRNGLPEFVQQMLGLADATDRVNSSASAFGQIGSNFAQSIVNGQGIQSAISSAFTGAGGQALSDVIGEEFNEALNKIEFDDDTLQNLAGGFALAIGQAVEGDIGQAAFTAAGNLVGEKIGSSIGEELGGFGGAIGSIIGSILGDALFGGSVPKFQVRGVLSGVDDAGTDRLVDGPLGRIEFAFRGIEDQAQSQIIRAFSEFDRSIAGVIRDEGQLEEVEAALDRFGVSSRSGPDNIEQQLELRFEAILSTFDNFTQEFVNQAITLDERVQRLNDLRQIGNLADLGRDFGLTFETLATVLDDVSIGGESLINTFSRLEPAVLGLQRAADLTGNAFAESAEGLARFSADLLEIFGDDAGQFTGILNRVLEAAFSDAELNQQTIDAARQRATDLLTGLGISVSEDTFSQEGLRELIDNFLGNLGPEQTAILLEAGDAIATLIQAEADLADERGDSIDQLRDDFLQAIEDIRGVLDSQLLGTSSLTPRERLDLSEQRLIEAAQAAQGGDLDAARDLPGLFQEFIGISARAFGTATDDFARNEAFARELLGSLELGPDAIPVNEAQLEALNSIQGLAQSQLAALESIRDSLGDTPSFNTGGPVTFDGLANVDRGEFVVPQGGALVQRDDRVVQRLESIEARLGEGNSDRRQGVELQVERLESIVAAQEEEIRNLRLNSNKRPTGSESRANVIRQTRT